MLACYAVAVALNGFLPANLGTWVMLLMFTTLIVGATFTMVFSGLLVEKIPFTVFNVWLHRRRNRHRLLDRPAAPRSRAAS